MDRLNLHYGKYYHNGLSIELMRYANCSLQIAQWNQTNIQNYVQRSDYVEKDIRLGHSVVDVLQMTLSTRLTQKVLQQLNSKKKVIYNVSRFQQLLNVDRPRNLRVIKPKTPQKGGDSATRSRTAALLRLRHSHQLHPRRLPPNKWLAHRLQVFPAPTA